MNLTISPIRFSHSINNEKIDPNINISNFKIKDIDKNKFLKEKSINQYFLKNSSKTCIPARIFTEKKFDDLRKKVEQQKKQLLLGDEFFINMEDYGKNEQWARQMEALTYSISFAISNEVPFREILAQTEEGVKLTNAVLLELLFSDTLYGKRRISYHTFSLLENTRGCEYIDRYREKSKIKNSEFTISENTFPMYSPRPNEEYKDANVSKIGEFAWFGVEKKKFGICQDSAEEYSISNLSLVEKEFNKLKGMKNPSVDDVMRSCAIIQWLIAQETPYVRGSDSIANVLTKAIMHANNIFISPLKDGISLDFEAFDTDLDDYIEKYPDFFKIRPYSLK